MSSIVDKIDIDEMDLADVVEVASIALQEIQDRTGHKNDQNARVSFPRGYLQKVATIRKSLPDLSNELLIRNISYSLMMLDVLRWLLIRTDLAATAASMTCKEVICIYGSICESLLKEVVPRSKKQSFQKGSQWLVEKNVIGPDLRTEIDWIWSIRTNEHLYIVNDLEHEMYSRNDVNRARKAFYKFCEKLKTMPETAEREG